MRTHAQTVQRPRRLKAPKHASNTLLPKGRLRDEVRVNGKGLGVARKRSLGPQTRNMRTASGVSREAPQPIQRRRGVYAPGAEASTPPLGHRTGRRAPRRRRWLCEPTLLFGAREPRRSDGRRSRHAHVSSSTAVYGSPPAGLVATPNGALQVSPLAPGGAALEEIEAHSLSAMVMSAPPGVLERRYQLALALRALAPGAPLLALAPKDRGGARLRRELEAFGCRVEETAKRHHRICACVPPDTLGGGAQALEDGAARFVDAMAMWSQPGVFSWDRIDPGSALLARSLPALAGAGADLGCGVGYLAKVVLRSPGVERLRLVDIDRRAIAAARRNVDDPRAELQWADALAVKSNVAGATETAPRQLDFVVTNPPFHDGGAEDRELGQAFIRSAAQALRKGGGLWLVANRHLPYESTLTSLFTRVEVRAQEGGYKVFEARR